MAISTETEQGLSGISWDVRQSFTGQKPSAEEVIKKIRHLLKERPDLKQAVKKITTEEVSQDQAGEGCVAFRYVGERSIELWVVRSGQKYTIHVISR